MCVIVIIMNPKEIIKETPNLIFYHMKMPLEIFYEDWTNNLCTVANISFLIHYGLRTEFVVRVFHYIPHCTQYKEIYTHFWHA